MIVRINYVGMVHDTNVSRAMSVDVTLDDELSSREVLVGRDASGVLRWIPVRRLIHMRELQQPRNTGDDQ